MAVTKPATSALHFQALTATGSSQVDALPISYEASPAFVVAAGNDLVGLILPQPGKGKTYYVSNSAAGQMGNLYVYPPVGVQINGLGVNASLTLPPTTAVMFVAGGGQWWTCPVVPS
jgi:hypothetical protein